LLWSRCGLRKNIAAYLGKFESWLGRASRTSSFDFETLPGLSSARRQSTRWMRCVMMVRKWLLLAIMLAFAGGYLAPLLATYIANSEQDECTFGPVSNQRYREYLDRAKVLSSKLPGGFTRDNQIAKARFDELFEALAGAESSVFERLAASHALLRAFGAQYRNTNNMAPDSYATVARTGGFISVNYYLNINRLGVFQPVMQQAWVVVSLTGPGDFYRGPTPSVAGDIRFVVNYPTFDPPLPFIDRAPEQCPLVPTQSLSELFSRTNR
jgi:hypothetical protein